MKYHVKILLLILTGFVLVAFWGCGDSTVRLIKQLKTKRNIDTGDGTVPVRYHIAEQLGNTGDARAIVPLLDVLNSPDEYVHYDLFGKSKSLNGKGTYPAAIDALGKFGPRASLAVPRLKELLEDKNMAYLTPVILKALIKIEPLDALIPIFVKNANSSGRVSDYLREYKFYAFALRSYAKMLVPVLRKMDIPSLEGPVKGQLLSFWLYCGVSKEDMALIVTLLGDAQALRWVDVSAFKNGEELVPQILALLKSFNEVFPESVLVNYGSTCGPHNIQGIKNSLRGKLFSILIEICTPESLAAVENFKRENGISIVCEQSSGRCSKLLDR